MHVCNKCTRNVTHRPKVCPMKYAHCYVVICVAVVMFSVPWLLFVSFGVHVTGSPLIIRIASLALTKDMRDIGRYLTATNIATHESSAQIALQWRHNGRDGVSNHQPHHCSLNRLFRCRSKKTSKLRLIDLCAGNSPVTGEFPAQMTSNAENLPIWWRHHGVVWCRS